MTMNRRDALFLIASGATSLLTLGVAVNRKRRKSSPPLNEPIKPQVEPQEVKPPAVQPEVHKDYEPNWTSFAPLRQVKERGEVWSDIESHIQAGHVYRGDNPITSVHETTHGINSNLRQVYSRAGKTVEHEGRALFCSLSGINAFYVLQNRAAIILEPSTTVSAAAAAVPKSLQARTFNLYMVQQARSWNDTPLYVFDEWVAYTNGSACRVDLRMADRADTVESMFHFNVYAVCVAMVSRSDDPQVKGFIGWNLKRSMELYDQNKSLGGVEPAANYWEKFKTASDAETLRQFIRVYLGPEWVQRTLGI